MLFALTSTNPAAAQASVTGCDRTCLSSLLDAYPAALKAHEPHRLPLSKDVRFTDNGAPLAVGDGLWNTIDGVGDYRLPFIDPEDGQAGLFGVAVEDGKLGELFKIRGAKLHQIEALVMKAPYGLQDVRSDHPRWAPAH